MLCKVKCRLSAICLGVTVPTRSQEMTWAIPESSRWTAPQPSILPSRTIVYGPSPVDKNRTTVPLISALSIPKRVQV